MIVFRARRERQNVVDQVQIRLSKETEGLVVSALKPGNGICIIELAIDLPIFESISELLFDRE